MSKTSQNKSDRRRHRQSKLVSGYAEDRRSEAVTVAWMLSTVTTLVAEIIALIGLWWREKPAHLEQPNLLAALPPVMLFAACVTGLVVVCLAPLVYKFRRVPPPVTVTVAAIAIAVSPLLTILVLLSR